jgi:amidase
MSRTQQSDARADGPGYGLDVDLGTVRAVGALEAMATGVLTSAELLDAQLARIESWNSTVNAVVALDVERARAAARQADRARRDGRELGPLHGLPMTVKDSFETEGIVTTSGAPELRHHIPTRDADAVAALRRAGAIVFGKTNLPMYAGDFQTFNDVYGLTRNPWDTNRGAGGSSGGAAVAVAMGFSLLELGSDIGGSIRNPCHYNGVFGHKPTFGVVPHRGHIPGPPGSVAPDDLGVMGPIGRSVADLELALDVLTAGGSGRNGAARLPPSTVDPHSLRVGVIDRHPIAPTSADCRTAVERAAAALADIGASVRPFVVPEPSLDEQHRLFIALLRAVLSPGDPTASGAPLTHLEWRRLDERRWRLIGAYHDAFRDVDVVIAPVAPTAAFPHDTDTPFADRLLDVDGEQVEYRKHLAWAGFATLPLLPATAVPVMLTSAGLPVGVQIVGDRFADRTCLAVAAMLERELSGFRAPPLAARSSG